LNNNFSCLYEALKHIFPATNFLSVGVVSHQQVINNHSGKHDSSGKRSALKCQSTHILKASSKIICKIYC